jgi:Fe-S-cluster containining protein
MIAAALPSRIRREQLQPGEVLCSYCTARCCRYFALGIDTPTTVEDFDHIRWYLLHGRTAVFVDGGNWFLLVYADCQALQPNNMCGAYDSRPRICQSYSTENCEYEDDGVYDQFFETAQQVREYMQALFPEERLRRFSTAPPAPAEVKLPLIVAGV